MSYSVFYNFVTALRLYNFFLHFTANDLPESNNGSKHLEMMNLLESRKLMGWRSQYNPISESQNLRISKFKTVTVTKAAGMTQFPDQEDIETLVTYPEIVAIESITT